MYNYEWDQKTKGYLLSPHTGKYIASEIRPVYADELILLHGENCFVFNANNKAPLLWGRHNLYIYNGKEIAIAEKNEQDQFYIRFIDPQQNSRIELLPIDIKEMVQRNKVYMDSLVFDTKKRIKEIYDYYSSKCDVAYIGFSGGKDSMVLLDLCHQVLPISIPVIFSDTDMELCDTYHVWDLVQRKYFERPFIKVRANRSAIENWELFGPPSQSLRWCCAVHKSTPAILYLRSITKSPTAKTLAFVGVRADESRMRSTYDDIGDGLKNQSQVNAMPILSWGAHELFLYTFEHELIINKAYRKGLPRVGCLLCPMASDRQVDIIRSNYPKDVERFSKSIKKSIARKFTSEKDLENFVFSGGWHARRSGVSLQDIIVAPTEEKDGNTISFLFDPIPKKSLLEWLKTLGTVQELEKLNNTTKFEITTKKETVRVVFFEDSSTVTKLTCIFDSKKPDIVTIKYLKSVLFKTIGCVECRTCESECPTGALTINDGIHVNTDKCIHCMKCHSIEGGCLRYYSKRYAGGTTMNVSGINKYMTFGLKQEWVEVLAREKDNFRTTTVLGNRMIPSAITWFREALLIPQTGSVQPRKLLSITQKYGFDSDLFWGLVWFALVNNSPLFKWYICNTSFEESVSPEELDHLLSDHVNSSSVRRGAFQSLNNTLKHSPLGMGENPMVELTLKGTRVLGLKRLRKSVEPLVVLYSLYLMANIAGRTSFTLSEMMTADFESPYISPLIAFGMDIAELKGQCMGLASRYPKFISCSFTLGLDEVTVFPQEKSLDDVVDLILGE